MGQDDNTLEKVGKITSLIKSIWALIATVVVGIAAASTWSYKFIAVVNTHTKQIERIESRLKLTEESINWVIEERLNEIYKTSKETKEDISIIKHRLGIPSAGDQ